MSGWNVTRFRETCDVCLICVALLFRQIADHLISFLAVVIVQRARD